MKRFNLSEKLKRLVSSFTKNNFIANDGTLVLAMGCSPCTGCGNNCTGSCAGSCRGNCTYSCQRYNR